MPSYRGWKFWPVVLLMSLPVQGSLQAADWLTGSRLNKQLEATISASWSGRPLRDALASLSKTQQVAVFLDRRVDPSQLVELRLQDVTLQRGLELLAENQKLSVTMLGPLAYFGPPESTRELHTLIAIVRGQVDRVGRERRSVFLRPRSSEWAMLSVPSELLTKLASENGLELQGLDRMPHDLWPAADLPPMPLIARLVLVAASFDMTVQIAPTGTAVRIVPIERPVRMVRDYDAGASPQQVADKLARFLPDAELKVSNQRLYVRGRWEDHQRVEGALRGEPIKRTTSSKPAAGRNVFTLTIQNQPAGPVLRQLAAQLQLELEMDEQAIEQAGIKLDRRISFQVTRATRDALLKAALTPAELTYRLEGKVLTVSPAKQ